MSRTDEQAPQPPLTPRLRRLLVSLLPANLSIFLIWGATTGVLLQAQVQDIDPANKESNYALIAGVGALLALIAQPIAGVVSDRTRSRFGKRAPWLVGGAVVGSLALIGIGSAHTILQVFLSWCAVQVSLNFTQGPLSAVLPDRVPAGRRGLFSSMMGFGLLAGMLGGQILGALLVPRYMLAYLLLGGFVILAIVAFVLLNPAPPNTGEPRPSFDARRFLQTFWVNPIAHPDFFWAFAGRLLINTGYTLISTYSLFILQDYIGLSTQESLTLLPVVSGAGLVGMLITTLTSGPLSDRLGRRRVFVFASSAILTVALLIPLVAPSVPGILGYAFIGGLGFGVFQSVDTALITEVLPDKDDYGKDLGVINIAATLPQTIAPAAAGLIVLWLGGYVALFPWAIAFVLLGGLSVWRIRSVR